MKTNDGKPSTAVRSGPSSRTYNQNRHVHNEDAPKTVGDERLISALAYRFWCLFLHKFVLMMVFILIPLLITVIIILLKRSKIIGNLKQIPMDVYISKEFTVESKMWYCSAMTPIGVSALNTSLAKRMMSLISVHFKLMGFEFGPVVYKSGETELSRYMANASGENNDRACGFGIDFKELSNTSLTYTLRSVKKNNPFTDKLFPDNMPPGPMDNAVMYLKDGFSLLQSEIDTAYCFVVQSEIQNFESFRRRLSARFQGFPYPAHQPIDQKTVIVYERICLIAVTGIIFIAAVFGLWMVQEKASGMKELLKINGTKLWMLYSSWFCMYNMIALLIAILITIGWKYPLESGALIPNTTSTIIFIIIIVYFASLIACVGFLCSLSSSSTFVIVIIILHFLFTTSLRTMVPRKTFVLCLISLIPNPGLLEIVNVMIYLEMIDSGVYYSNIFHVSQTASNNLPIGVTLLIMAAGSVLHILLMVYIDAIKPGQYGRAKPWRFCFKFCQFSRTVHPASRTPDSRSDTNALIEATDVDKLVGLKIVNLVKSFGSVNAVNGLNWTIYKNEITVLLGHNGAGKSTAFNMICGMFSPTSGTIYTESYNIFSENHIALFRTGLGYCPQHDLLFPELSVQEHLVFFGMVKGLTKGDALERSDYWTKKFKFYHRRDSIASQLSGGMKRKLCLSIALVGDTPYLLLDEPTSGLDPESRRDIWDVLLSVRGNRTVVISTHDMEEAEVLGDRIAIIANGSLKCYGTPMFLKYYYGFGYQLKIATGKNNKKNILSLIQGIVPSARLLNKTENLMTVSLPAQEVAKFPALFSEIDSRFKYNEYSLSATNMGDVFIKVQEEEGVKAMVNPADMPFLPKEEQKRKTTNTILIFVALAKKRWAWACRKWIPTIVNLMVVPVIGVTFTFATFNAAYDLFSVTKSLKLDLTMYKNSTVLTAARKNASIASAIQSVVTKKGSKYLEIPADYSMVQALLDTAEANLTKYQSNYVVAYDLAKSIAIVFYSNLAYHSLPIAWNTFVNAILQEFNIWATISTYSFPYQSSSMGENCAQVILPLATLLTLMMMMTAPAMAIAFSGFVLFPHTDRITGFKHLQIMTGVQIPLYWLANLILDVIFSLIGVSLSLIALLVLDIHEICSQYNVLNSIALALYLYGVCSIPYSYFASSLFKTSVWSMYFVLFSSLFVAIVHLVAIYIPPLEWFPYITYLVPWVAFIACLAKIFIFLIQFRVCESCEGLPTSDCKKIHQIDVTTEFIYMAVDVFLYLAIIILIDYGAFKYLAQKICEVSLGEIEKTDEPTDANVVSEKQAIEAFNEQRSSSASIPTFLCDGLGKKFSRSIVAVYDVSFVIPKNECFGLLGTNGAGKTTTFRMLTGIHVPTKGDASIFSYSLSLHREEYLKRLGYCPQQDGLIPDLSARKHLMLFGHLRGIPSSKLNGLVQKWIDVLEMTHICDRPCKTYSGGNKRKLSTAIALIGDPPVVVLDEPTTGVDPVVSRKIWSILKHCRDKNRQTIILTSHSMDECEAVCERLTIMVNGRMKCLGTVPYLKNTYGRGFVLVVKLKYQTTEQETQDVKRKTENTFAPHIRLANQQRGLFTFFINSAVPLQKIFQEMISVKASMTNIEDFNVSNVSLEQIFISFAEAQ